MFYDGEKVDIFALGVLLFIMYIGVPPFKTAKESDVYFKCLNGN